MSKDLLDYNYCWVEADGFAFGDERTIKAEVPLLRRLYHRLYLPANTELGLDFELNYYIDSRKCIFLT